MRERLMKEHKIIWTACPNGIVGGQLRLSVYVSHRLGEDEGNGAPGRYTLGDFPDALAWPRHDVTFTVNLQGRNADGALVGSLATLTAAVRPPALDLGMWDLLFDAASRVEPFEFAADGLDKATSHTFGVQDVYRHLRSQYSAMAVDSPYAPPTVSQLNGGTDNGNGGLLALTVRGEEEQGLRQRIHALRRPTGKGFSSAAVRAAGPQFHFYEATRYFTAHKEGKGTDMGSRANVPPATPGHRTGTRPQRAPRAVGAPIPSLDVHALLGSLSQYPELMRRVGLVFDLEVPIPDPMPHEGLVWITPDYVSLGDDVTPRDLTPRTAYTMFDYTLSDVLFLPAPRPRQDNGDSSDFKDGWLTLGDTDKFEIFELDIDGALLKVSAYASTIATIKEDGPRLTNPSDSGGSFGTPPRRGPPPPNLQVAPALAVPGTTRAAGGPTPSGAETLAAGDPTAPATSNALASDTALPALRSAGISVARVDHFHRVVQPDLAAANANNDRVLGSTDGSDLVFYAEDITRGYRVDVYQDSRDGARADWYPLCARQGNYTFTANGRVETYQDEGWVALGATRPPNDPSVLNVHEVVTRWAGWSLATPRPDVPPPTKQQQDNPKPVQGDLRVRALFTPQKGSLPSLRFGHTYKLRARAVDLAGNSVPFTMSDSGVPGTEGVLPSTYARFEPLGSPALVARTEEVRGESSARVVIRSNVGIGAAAYVAPGDAGPRPTAERHLVPPVAAESLAEAHGRFDEGGGRLSRDPQVYRLITAHEGVLPDGEPAPRLTLPYLPDPLARGIAGRGWGGQPLQHARPSRAWDRRAGPSPAGRAAERSGPGQPVGRDAAVYGRVAGPAHRPPGRGGAAGGTGRLVVRRARRRHHGAVSQGRAAHRPAQLLPQRRRSRSDGRVAVGGTEGPAGGPAARRLGRYSGGAQGLASPAAATAGAPPVRGATRPGAAHAVPRAHARPRRATAAGGVGQGDQSRRSGPAGARGHDRLQGAGRLDHGLF